MVATTDGCLYVAAAVAAELLSKRRGENSLPVDPGSYPGLRQN